MRCRVTKGSNRLHFVSRLLSEHFELASEIEKASEETIEQIENI